MTQILGQQVDRATVVRVLTALGFGVEAAWWESFHAIVQALVQGSPFPDTGIRQVDWPAVLLVMGGRYYFQKSSIEFSLTEDPDTAGTPDFILNVSYAMKF